jgi:RND superfamily putative drug exporter
VLHLARIAVRHPKATLAGWVVFAAVMVAVGLNVAGGLSPQVTVVAGSESSRAQTLADSRFGPSVLVPIMLQGPARQLNAQGPKLVLDLSRRRDSRVMSAWSSGSAAAALRPNPNTAMIVVSVARSERAMLKTAQPQIDRLVRRDISSPVRAYVTGQPTLDRALRDSALSTTKRAELIAIPILFVLLTLLLGSPLSALVISIFGVTTVFVSFGVMTLLGRVSDVDPTAVALGSMTGLALGVGYALMLVRRFREEETAERSRADAAHAATASVATTGRAVLYGGTAITLSLLLAVAIAPTVILSSLGIGVLLCTLISVGGAVAVLPAVLVLAGHRLDVWHLHRVGFMARGWARLVAVGDAIVRKPVAIGALATAVLVVLCVPLLNIQTGPPDVRQLPASSQARQSFEQVARVMGPGWPTPYNVLVVSKKEPITTTALLLRIGRFEKQIAADERVDSVVGPGTFLVQTKDLKKLPAGLDQSAAVAKSSKKDLLRLKNGLGLAGAGAVQLRSGLAAASSGAGQLNGGSGAAQSGAGQLRGGLAQASSGASAISVGLKSALAGAISLRDGARQALAGSKQLQGGLGTANTPVQAGLPLVRQMAADSSSASKAIASGQNQAAATASDIDNALAAIQGINGIKNDPGYGAAIGALNDAKAAANDVSSTLGGAASSASSAASVGAAFADQTAQLANGLSRLYSGSTDLAAGIAKLESGNSQLAGGLTKLNAGGGSLNSGLVALRNGAGALESGLGQLTAGTGQLQSGLGSGIGPAGQLAAGLGTMEAAVVKARSQIPSTKDLVALKKQSPGLFDSGYFVLAAIAGASPSDQAQAGFAVNLKGGGDAGQIVVISKQGASAQSTQELGAELRRMGKQFARSSGTTVAVGGPAGFLSDFRSVTQSRIWIVVPVVALAVMLFLMIVLRAVLLPIVAVAFDLLTVGASFGILTLLYSGSDRILGGPGYLDPMSIIGIFAIMFGVTATYEVLLLVRAREHYLRLGHSHEAMRLGLRGTAATATGAALVMVAAVLPFAFSDLVPVQQFGIGVAAVVLIDALIVRPLMLPAAAAVFGRRGWWPTAPGTDLPPEVPSDEAATEPGPPSAREPEPVGVA